MRVLIAATVPQLPELIGGTQFTLSALARWLKQADFETAILGGIIQVPPQLGNPTWRCETYGDMPVYRAVDANAALPAVIADWRPDAAIVHFDGSAQALVEGLQARGVPCIVYLDTPFAKPMTLPQPGPKLCFAALSPFIARRAKTLFGVEARILPPIIETQPTATPAGVNPRAGDSVLMVNPTTLKGVGIFLQLAAALPEIPFLAVESWDLSEAWRNILINRAMTLGNVALWPAMDDIGEALARARVLLMPSIHEETWGRIITEAQARGVPAVVSDRGALPETLGPGGIVVPLDAGLETWAGALKLVFEDSALYARLSAAGQAHAAQDMLRPETIAGAWAALLSGTG